MKLAFIQAYNEADWIGYSIDQAMKFCDRLVLAEGAQWVGQPDISERSDDGTLDIIEDKRLEYRRRIKVFNTTRKYNNYRKNQCANFNQALTHCKLGDYFITFDCDEFFFDSWIRDATELMKYGVDMIQAQALNFVLSFDWIIDFGSRGTRPIVFRKIRDLRFKPTHRPFGYGSNEGKIPGIGSHHYVWLKRRKRLLTRVENGRRPHMAQWLKESWDDIELKEGIAYRHEADIFRLERFRGNHPSILDSHPWRHAGDIRGILK